MEFLGKNKVKFFYINALYLMTVLPLFGFDPRQREISLPEYTSMVWNPRSNGNIALLASFSGVLVTYTHCKTKLPKKFLPVVGMTCLVLSLIHLSLLVVSFTSSLNMTSKVENDIDNFCNKPVVRNPVENYG